MTYRRVHELLNAPSIPSRTVRDVQRHDVVVAHLQAGVDVGLQVTLVPLLEQTPPGILWQRASTDLTAGLQVALAVFGSRELLEDE